jgi:NADH dehydrogenase
MNKSINKPRVVIVGGGFGGLNAAKKLGNKNVEVKLIDRKNHFIFQPLLYQVASSVLSPGEISTPIRRALNRYRNMEVLLGEVTGFDLNNKLVKLKDNAEIPFDYLIVGAGARHSYFGHNEWEEDAPGLKTIDDAIEIRRRIFLAFELAERDAILTGTHRPLVFAVVGGGPTGVELAGAIAGIAREALAGDFKAIDTKRARILLFEGMPRLLTSFPEDLSQSAEKQLRDLGVEVFTNTLVEEVNPGKIKVGEKWIECSLAIWATGVAASPLGKLLGGETDGAGRVPVNPDLSIPSHQNIFVVGDLSSLQDTNGVLVPGVAGAAIQEGENAAENILLDLSGKSRKAFKYVDKGSMATIGRNKAIAKFGNWHYTGFVAWLMWLFVHIVLLAGFRNRLAVLSEWAWAYFTRDSAARLITGEAKDLPISNNSFLKAPNSTLGTKSLS